MYIQYREINGILTKIQDNIRSDEQNKKFWDSKEYDKVFSDWREGDILYIGNTSFKYPVEENGKIREKTEKELIKEGIKKLPEGQYISGEEIITVEIPSNLLKAIWNKEAHIWEEGATREELIEERKNKIVQYEKLEEEKKLLEKSKFSSEDEMKAIIEKMANIEGDINTLQDKIKAL
jgi:hypothetical protein|nr:MAG TPA: hypothetical protein [Caudoviricetes sp.]